MRFFVSITDYDWFQLHASQATVEEVNFWKPNPQAGFQALRPSEPFLFKLHSPRNFIVGGGFFTKFLKLPVSLAWEAFGKANGALSLQAVRSQIARYRHAGIEPGEDPQIGCIMLAEPFFFAPDAWIPSAPYFRPHIQVGRTYDTNDDLDRKLWLEVSDRLRQIETLRDDPGPALVSVAEPVARYGEPVLVAPRLGQGLFRILVTDAYGRRCAMTGDKTLPVREAAHIKPYSEGGRHELSNGLLLRSDLHRLFDKGYLAVNPDNNRVLVSNRLKSEFDNGKEYYPLQDREILLPAERAAKPSREFLRYHRDSVFH